MSNKNRLHFLWVYLIDPKVSLIKKLWVFAPLAYLLLPTDIVPDFLFGPGFIDDIIVILFLFGKIKHDLDKYIFERNRNRTGTGPVIENVEYKVHQD